MKKEISKVKILLEISKNIEAYSSIFVSYSFTPIYMTKTSSMKMSIINPI